MKNADEPIYPITNYAHGLTKREYFAAMLLQAIITKVGYAYSKELTASDAVKWADALLSKLEKSEHDQNA